MRINRKKIINKAWWLIGVMGICLHMSIAAQTCDPSVPATAPASRFNDNGDGTATDRKTGLMWKQCMEGKTGHGCGDASSDVSSLDKFNWQQALQRAETSEFAGYQDWRLPNIKELASIVERKCRDSAINSTIFPRMGNSYFFWSGSPALPTGSSIDASWGIIFGTGAIEAKNRDYNYWGKALLVRDTQL